MSFAELVQAVASKANVSLTVANRVLKALSEEVPKALETDESVKLRGFGAFYVVEVQPKGNRKIRFRQSRRK